MTPTWRPCITISIPGIFCWEIRLLCTCLSDRILMKSSLLTTNQALTWQIFMKSKMLQIFPVQCLLFLWFLYTAILGMKHWPISYSWETNDLETLIHLHRSAHRLCVMDWNQLSGYRTAVNTYNQWVFSNSILFFSKCSKIKCD